MKNSFVPFWPSFKKDKLDLDISFKLSLKKEHWEHFCKTTIDENREQHNNTEKYKHSGI